MKIGGKYNWIGQHERLVYLGDNFSGNGYWHQFAKVETPTVVWCELKGCDLHMIERTPHEDAPVAVVALPKRCAAGRDGDCTHRACPQLRDGEPKASGRHCPLDADEDDTWAGDDMIGASG